jgi:uncharacterized protein (DUF952 family)
VERATDSCGAGHTRRVLIYHLALRSDWDDAVAAGSYRVSTVGATIDEVGYIHASREGQVQATAERFYAGLGVPLVLLVLDRDRLEAGGVPVVDDPIGDDTFPHLYAALPVDLVDEVRTFTELED